MDVEVVEMLMFLGAHEAVVHVRLAVLVVVVDGLVHRVRVLYLLHLHWYVDHHLLVASVDYKSSVIAKIMDSITAVRESQLFRQ